MTTSLNDKITALVFAGSLGLLPGLTVANWSAASNAAQSPMEQWLSGAVSQQWEQQFDNNFVIREWSISAMAAVTYLGFREGTSEVAVGEGDWMFSREELVQPANSDDNIRQNFLRVLQTSDYLASRNIRLLVVPVPAKARVLSHHLAQRPALAHQQVYAQLLDFLGDHRVSVVDTLKAMSINPEQPLYFQRDTHWTPNGAQLVAKATARYCQNQINLSLNNLEFVTEARDIQEFAGDLMNFIPLQPLFSQFQPSSEEFIETTTYAKQSNLFGSSDVAVSTLLVGTSYSADSRWNFEGYLKQALGRDLLNLASEGRGPFAPMLSLMQQPSALEGVELVIWEIPERYLLQAYPDLDFSTIPKSGVPKGQYTAQLSTR
tara:strand:- start:131 stop:1258 length:1128 start_codon:yes stop_codon:yes gene_type:complete